MYVGSMYNFRPSLSIEDTFLDSLQNFTVCVCEREREKELPLSFGSLEILEAAQMMRTGGSLKFPMAKLRTFVYVIGTRV